MGHGFLQRFRRLKLAELVVDALHGPVIRQQTHQRTRQQETHEAFNEAQSEQQLVANPPLIGHAPTSLSARIADRRGLYQKPRCKRRATCLQKIFNRRQQRKQREKNHLLCYLCYLLLRISPVQILASSAVYPDCRELAMDGGAGRAVWSQQRG